VAAVALTQAPVLVETEVAVTVDFQILHPQRLALQIQAAVAVAVRRKALQ
jgi:hypothetical protein